LKSLYQEKKTIIKKTAEDILILPQNTLKELLDMKEIIKIVEEAFKLHAEGKVIQPVKNTIHYGEGGRYRLTSLPCYINKKGAGIKWVANNRDNRNKGLPTISAVLILNDDETSMPISIMDAAWLTSMRTAGHATVAAKYLAKKDSNSIAIIGCGIEGRTHLEAMNEIFRIQEIRVYDIRKDFAEKYAEEMEEKLNIKIQVVENVSNSVKDADIVCMTTSASKPVVMSKDVGSGCFIAGTALFRDLDPQLSKDVDKWVLGNVESDFPSLSKSQRIIELSKDDVYGELGEIIMGIKPGRENDIERILFSHAGMGLLDVLTGLLIYHKAKVQGVGLQINLF